MDEYCIVFQPTRPLRGATAGSQGYRQSYAHFNPRAPCGARRFDWTVSIWAACPFQPTRPLRGATCSLAACTRLSPNFNPRAPCGARRPCSKVLRFYPYYFNPRAPCGARPFISVTKCYHNIFQPTRPLRGATTSVIRCRERWWHFNPRAPCGARLQRFTKTHGLETFQPTRPLRGATVLPFLLPFKISYFNPRAPCGARRFGAVVLRMLINFNPRAPCGARPFIVPPNSYSDLFQPTRPLRGATAKVYKSLCTFLR